MSADHAKDPKNQYRTGVLMWNHVEDRFGQELAAKPVSLSPHPLETPAAPHHRVTLEVPPGQHHASLRL